MSLAVCARPLPRISRQFAGVSALHPKAFKYAFVDIDGTLIDSRGAIPGAVGALARLRKGVSSVRFVTNNSQEGGSTLAARLQAMDFSLHKEEVFGALAAARSLVERHQLRPLLLLSDLARGEFKGIQTDNPNAVVIGTAPEHLHYERLNEALRVLMNSEGENQLIAVNKGRYFQGADGFVMMAGPFVAGLEFATGKSAAVVGKPSKEFFNAAVRDVSGSSLPDAALLEQCVMIGDDSNDDVQGALDAGMRAILVRTGKYRIGDEQRCRTQPLAVVSDFAEAVDFLYQEGLLT